MPLELRLRPGGNFRIRGVRGPIGGEPVEKPPAQGEPVFEKQFSQADSESPSAVGDPIWKPPY